MKILLLFATLVVTTLLAGCVTTGQKITTTELHNKQKVDISAEVYPVKSDKAMKAPTVILLHGCSGPERLHIAAWVESLNGWGYNAVVLNSLSPRGVYQVCSQPFAAVSPEQRSVDAHDTAKWVIQQPWATDKVGIVGFSHGAMAVVAATAKSYVERNFGKQVISAAVAYYPHCDVNFTIDKPANPIQFHIAGRDTWSAPSPCKDLARSWGMLENFYLYDNATHGFDLPYHTLGPPDANGIRHRIDYDAEYTALAKKRTKEFFDKQLR